MFQKPLSYFATRLDDEFRVDVRINCPSCDSLVEFNDADEVSIASCPICGGSLTDNEANETISLDGSQKTVGHFQLLNKIGSGGFGNVWKARDTKLDRHVAIKIPNREDLTARERQAFLREARAAAQLQHPNIVGVYEIGTRADELFIVCDFVQGSNLKEWLTGYQPSSRQVAELLMTIANALHHAHENGVIHRDLKPANIMMDLENQPHIMDFGLAKREAGEATMTMDGQVMGTPMYMSPEQAGGKSRDVDCRADIYSLGVMFFQMLTGERPFRGEPQVVMSKILTEDAPSPRSLKISVPKDLETICLKCLEREPSLRYSDAESVALELGRFLNNEPIIARPISKVAKAWRFCRRWPVTSSLAALLFLAVTIGFIGVSTQWNRAERNANNFANEEARKGQYLYVAHMNIAQQAWVNGLTSRVRELLDRHLPTQGKPDLKTFEWYYYDSLCREALALPTLDYGDIIATLAVSPSGNLVALAGYDNEVQVWSLDTNTRMQVMDVFQYQVTNIQFSADDNVLLTVDQKQAVVWHRKGAEFVEVFRSDPSEHFTAIIDRVSQKIAVSNGTSISLLDLASGAIPIDLASFGQITDFCFAENGAAIIVAGVTGSGQVSVGRINTISKEHNLILTREDASIEPASTKILLSENEKRLLISSGVGGEVFDVSSDGSLINGMQLNKFPQRVLHLKSLGTNEGFAAVSATSLSTWNWDHQDPAGENQDPRKFDAFVAASEIQSVIATTGTDSVVYLWNNLLEPLGTVRGHSNKVYSMDFLPHGGMVTASRDKTAKIWHTLKSKNTKRLYCCDDWLWSVAISPDSQTLAVAARNSHVYLWDLKQGELICELTEHSDSVQFVAFSPNGKLLATGGHDSTIKIWDYKKQRLVRELLGHSECVNSFDFSPDGKKLASGSNDGRVMIWDVESGKALKTMELESQPDIWAVKFSPNGQDVVFGGMNHTVSAWRFMEHETSEPIVDLDENVTSISFSKDGKFLSITTADGLITLWDNQSNQQHQLLIGHSGDAMHTAFSPDGKTLVSGGSEGVLQFWNVATGEPTITIKEHDDHVHCVAFSKDGKNVVSASWDGSSMVLNAE